MMPCSSMEDARSANASSSNRFRGWFSPGSTWEMGSRTEPASWLCRVAASPMRASSPRPRPLVFPIGSIPFYLCVSCEGGRASGGGYFLLVQKVTERHA